MAKFRDGICVIGDAFFDIIVPVENIGKGGAFKKNISIRPGGTANVAVWTRRLGMDAMFVGRVGNDPFGIAFKEDLKNEKVHDLTAVDVTHPTGICLSLIKKGERTMITSRGANDHWEGKMLSLVDNILQAGSIYCTGFSLISKRDTRILESILQKCKSKCEIWFNVGAYNLITPKLRKFIRYADFVILNEKEANALVGRGNLLNKLKKFPFTTIMTAGKKGNYVIHHNKIIHVPTHPIKKVVDPTGAGDAFAAGFIVGKMKGYDLRRCSMLGHETATKVLRRIGAR